MRLFITQQAQTDFSCRRSRVNDNQKELWKILVQRLNFLSNEISLFQAYKIT